MELKRNIHPLIEEQMKSLQEAGCIVASLDVEKKGIVVINPDPDVRAAYRQVLNPFQPQGAAYEGIEELSVKNGEYLIQGSFENMKVYNPILPGKPRKIEFDVVSTVNSSPMHLGPSTEKDMLSALNQLGLVPDKKNGPENLTIVINAYIQSQKAEICQGFDTPGFYKDPQSDGILPVGYSVKEKPLEELKPALMILTRISSKFPRSLNRFSAAVKHSLSAPFSYYLRQRSIYPQHLMFYGITGTSKTALMLVNHGIWGLWDPESSNHGFFISGGEADTPSRIGERLEQGTFTVIIDEGEGLFLKSDGRENVPVIGILKHAMQSLVSRQTSDRGTFQALASVAIASNVKPPRGAAPILSRMATYESGSSEQIHASLSDKEKFQKTQNELYSQLSPIGQYVAARAVANPDILTADFEAFGETMLREMYTYAGLEVPEWVNIHAEPTSVEDLDRDNKEEIRIFVVKTHLEVFSRSIGRVGILETNSRGGEYAQYDSMTNVSAEEKIRHVIKNGLIPWQIFKDTKGVEQVILTIGFAKDISRIVGEAYNLQSIGELLSFECKYVRIGNSTPWTIVAGLEEYLKFLIPEIEDNVPCGSDQDKESEIREKLRSLNPKVPELPENASTEEKKARVEAPWKREEESVPPSQHQAVSSTSSSGEKQPEEIHENSSAQGMDPILRLLIDCTYNSSKKFKTLTELFNSSIDPELTQKKIYVSLEELVKNGKAVKQGTGYASKDVLEGRA